MTHRYQFLIHGDRERLSIIITRSGDGAKGTRQATDDIRDATAEAYALWQGIHPDANVSEIEVLDIELVQG